MVKLVRINNRDGYDATLYVSVTIEDSVVDMESVVGKNICAKLVLFSGMGDPIVSMALAFVEEENMNVAWTSTRV